MRTHTTSKPAAASVGYLSLLARENRIERRIALRGNHASGGCQTSKNVALTRDNAFATLHCVSVTHAHYTVRQYGASFGNVSFLEAFEHIVGFDWHTTTLFL